MWFFILLVLELKYLHAGSQTCYSNRSSTLDEFESKGRNHLSRD